VDYRRLGRTNMTVSRISFGAWAIGGFWGPVDDEQSMAALHAAVDAGVNFIDTADVYGDGRSERLVARLRKERPGETIWVATKAGRKLPEQTVQGYCDANLRMWVDESLRNLEMDAIDLLQLHCPPRALYDMPDVFGCLDELVAAGTIRYYGVSVESVDEALAAMNDRNVQSVQIIFNVFRQKPIESLFPAARAKDVGVIARVPLASGLLTGKFTRDTTFPADDHRTFNRHGERFDMGETFSGIPLEVGLEAVERLRPLVPEGSTLARTALRWILMFDAVTCAIPGARTAAQAIENAAACDQLELPANFMAEVRRVYDELVRAHVHDRW
jgi:aryl-alcohol dehydrogenase-like predicted oxidoreductase